MSETKEIKKKKPIAKLVGQDGNVFNLIGICKRALQKAGQYEEAKKMQEEVMKSGDYSSAIGIMGNYCELR